MAATYPEHIDKDIDKYLILLSDLRFQRNSFLPVFRLPPETLANVFIHAARDYHEGNHCLASCVPHWVNVSYVCRRWREVALSCPTLWAYHFNVSPRWSEELLARSKQASLKIRIRYGYRSAEFWWPYLVERVLSHVDRIQELRFDVPASVLPAELSLNAPRLEILDIHLQTCPSQHNFKIDNGDTLPLRTLKLSGCPLPWHSSLNLGGVTTLFLRFVPRTSQQDIVEFLTTLSRMQALTVLHLEHALPSARGFLSSGAFGVFPKVTLSCLVHLFVRSPPSTTVALLSCVDIPLKTRVRLEIGSEVDGSSVNDISLLPSALAQRFSPSKDLSSPSPAIRSLVVRFSSESEVTISASERDDCDPDLARSLPPRDYYIPFMLHITTESSIAISDRDRIAGDICCSIPSSHVQALHVVYQPLSLDFWRKTLGHFDGLKHMRLSYGYIPGVVSLLALPDDGTMEDSREDITGVPDPTPGHTFVPGLEELELYRIKFASPWDFLSDIASESQLDALSSREDLDLTTIECTVRGEGAEEYGYTLGICPCDQCAVGCGY